MVKILCAVFLLAAAPACAQEPAREDYVAAVEALRQQRDAQANQVVEQAVRIAALLRELAKVKEDLEAARKKD